MAYADYEYYTTVYYGNAIKEADFPRFSARASDFLDYYTRNKARDNADLYGVKMACCAIAEQYQIIDAARQAAASGITGGSDKASETVGAHSVTYRSGGETAAAALQAQKEAEAALASAARMYLTGTGLLYRGGCSCTRRTQ